MPRSAPAKIGALRMEGRSPPRTGTNSAGVWLAGAAASAAGAAAAAGGASAACCAAVEAREAAGDPAPHATSANAMTLRNTGCSDTPRMSDLLAASLSCPPRSGAASRRGSVPVRSWFRTIVRGLGEQALGLQLVHELAVEDLRVGQLGRVRLLPSRHGLPHPVQTVRRDGWRPGQVPFEGRVGCVEHVRVVGLQILAVDRQGGVPV